MIANIAYAIGAFDFFKNIQFKNPEFAVLFALVAGLIVWHIFRDKKNYPTLTVSSSETIKRAGPTLKPILRHVLFGFRALALSLLILALMRPQSSSPDETVNTEGVDIVLDLDISGSMQERDFRPNRLEAAKETAAEFVKNRPNDRIGLVVFAGEAFTQCPITYDRDVLLNLMENVQIGMVEDGTAIGDGMGVAINRLRESEVESKVIILLTDGVNNSGSLDPRDAAKMAKNRDMKIYTIGVGTSRGQNGFDAELLRTIAETTGGKYFFARNKEGLEKIYAEIDEMETTKIETEIYFLYSEKYFLYALAAAILLALELLLGFLVFRKIP